MIVGEAPEELIKSARRPAKETGPQGAMAQLRGILDHDDVRPVLNRIVVPLVLLQSSKSTFVDADLAVNALEKARVDRAAVPLRPCGPEVLYTLTRTSTAATR